MIWLWWWWCAGEIAKLFPNLFGQPSVSLVPSPEPASTRPLKVGVVLSGGQAPGGHNVICGIFGECASVLELFVNPVYPRLWRISSLYKRI